jgi:polysaccharide export outer membrane protein
MLRQVATIIITSFILSPALAGASQESASKGPISKAATAKSTISKADYVLQPSDLIRVQIFQEDNLNREVRISQEFTVTLPLVNLIDLSRKTARQAESYIRDLYAKDFLVQPQVNLTVLEYAPRRVYVAGAVGAPGVVLFQQEQGLTLIEAISKANSFNRLADKKRVTLKRTLPDGTSETKTINVEELMKGDSSETWPLQPGDVINVPERVL